MKLEALGRLATSFARTHGDVTLEEVEVNPLLLLRTPLVAADGKPTSPATRETPVAPDREIRNLLKPESAACSGLHDVMNPGRIILRNLKASRGSATEALGRSPEGPGRGRRPLRDDRRDLRRPSTSR